MGYLKELVKNNGKDKKVKEYYNYPKKIKYKK